MSGDTSKWAHPRRAVVATNAFRTVIVSHDPKSEPRPVFVSSSAAATDPQRGRAEPMTNVDVFGMPSRAHTPSCGRRPPATFYEPPGHTHAPFACDTPGLRSAPATPVSGVGVSGAPPRPEDVSPRRGTPSSHAAQQSSSVFPNQPPQRDYSPAPRAQPPAAAGPAPASHAAQQRSSIFGAFGIESSHEAYPTDDHDPSVGGSRRAAAADRGWQPTDRAAELTSTPCNHLQMQSSSALPMGKLKMPKPTPTRGRGAGGVAGLAAPPSTLHPTPTAHPYPSTLNPTPTPHPYPYPSPLPLR